MSALPSWLSPLLDAERMRAVDAWAISDQGVPSLELMETAGRGLAALVTEVGPEGRVVVVCGKGNNGGDGLVAARVLRKQGREVEVLLVGAAPGDLTGDPAENLRRLPGDPPRPVAAGGDAGGLSDAGGSGDEAVLSGALDGAGVVVDALLGTGFSGAAREPVAGAIRAIAQSGAPVVAADVPSGVDASTGAVEGDAVRADATATFHAPKTGLFVAPGKGRAGTVRVVDIGIPPGGPGDADAGLIGPAVRELIPRRGAQSTKFSEGAVLVTGGSRGLTGAPCLVAEAAARAGAGYVTAAVPASLDAVFEVRLLEAMTRALPDRDGALSAEASGAVLEACERADALVLGPGLGRAPGTQELARTVAARAEVPLVLDADGLNAHAGRLHELARRSAPTILTPHAGELGRLLEKDSRAVEAARLHHARAAAAAARCVVVLKGDDTIVAEPGGRVAVSAGGSPALATAGTGDVLAGVTGAVLAKGVEPFGAACAAVWVHTRAGALAARERGVDGTIARDVIEALPAALRE
ncbi:MAG: ADP-dependent NAD(P)H-hydrate dehydratase / NAD(P)H-hydrate epimerase [Solirubrobacteraceae bacterium]|jgi:NAD(P)H-hydrate epimerase|nr:ADP-dependent NAD(P)H-hydrate dehydratase / NAD(P)H-hydrate epimerase [Solirubrobacteraceae bacterium]